MAKVGRNDPCPCGSTKKAKRCCMSQERLSADADARRALLALRDASLGVLAGLGPGAWEELSGEVPYLPELDLSLQVPLPALSPQVERARHALEQGGGHADTFAASVEELAAALDTPGRRLELARAVASLRDAGRVDAKLAAAAIVDLAEGRRSLLFVGSVARSIAVSSGHSRTPAGLLVAR